METPRRKSPASRHSIAIQRADRRIDLRAAAIRTAIRQVLKLEGVAAAELSIAIVDDPTIHQVNRDHLQHDYATDVISFVYHAERSSPATGTPRGEGLELEGEIVASAETAVREAAKHGWPAESELMLYIVHGLLHLCGYDDLTPPEKRIMRRREREMLSALGVSRPESSTRVTKKSPRS